MKDEVMAFIAKHRLLKPGATVLIAVSGGPDSMALLHFFATIKEEWQLRIIALSVDHELRGEESKEDLDYVAEICRQWGMEFVGTTVDVNSYKKEEHMGTQLAARILRYQFFEEQVKKYRADFLAFGHHGDDQIETMLMHFVRTAESSNFSGIPVKREFAGGHIIRPFLCATKKDLEDYCHEAGIIPRLDPSNEGTDYTRNFFRKKVVPLLKQKNPNLHTTVQYLSESFQADEEFLQMEAKKLVHELVQFQEEPMTATFDIAIFAKRPSALQRRAFHLILNYLYDELPKDLSYIHEEYFFSLLTKGKSNAKIDFPRHLKVEKAYNKLTLYFDYMDEKQQEFQQGMQIPGEVVLPNGAKLKATYIKEIPVPHKNTYVCSASDVALPFIVRTRRDGDRMSWPGLNGSKKIKDILMDAKVPLTDRGSLPIVTDNNGDIIWLVGLKKRDSIPNEQHSLYIQLTYEQGKL